MKKIELLKEIEALKAIVFQLQSRVTSLETRIAASLPPRPIEMPYHTRWAPYVSPTTIPPWRPGEIFCKSDAGREVT